MKKVYLLGIFCLLVFVDLAQPQSGSSNSQCSKSNCDCELQNLKISDGEKYQKALKDALTMKPEEKRELQVITTPKVVVASFKPFSKNNDCNYTQEEKDVLNNGGIWVLLPAELRNVYQSRRAEFGDKENRLKKLLGLAPEIPYKCFAEIEIDSCKVVRPFLSFNVAEKDGFFWRNWGNDTSLFTGLGYTCDWYYGDGCRYGLTEFNIPPKPEKTGNDYLKVIKVCTVETYLENTCNK